MEAFALNSISPVNLKTIIKAGWKPAFIISHYTYQASAALLLIARICNFKNSSFQVISHV
jgi:hypothetical protein